MIHVNLDQVKASLNGLGETAHNYADRVNQALPALDASSAVLEKNHAQLLHKGNVFAVSIARGSEQVSADIGRIVSQTGIGNTALSGMADQQLPELENLCRKSLHSLGDEVSQSFSFLTTEDGSLRGAHSECEQALGGLSRALQEFRGESLGALDALEVTLTQLQTGFEEVDTELIADLNHQVQEFTAAVPQCLNSPFAALHLDLEGPLFTRLDQATSQVSQTAGTVIQTFVAGVGHAAGILEHEMGGIFSAAVSTCKDAVVTTIQTAVDNLVHSVLVDVGQQIVVSLGLAEAGAALTAALGEILVPLLAARAALKVINWLLEQIPLLKDAINFLLDYTPIGLAIDIGIGIFDAIS